MTSKAVAGEGGGKGGPDRGRDAGKKILSQRTGGSEDDGRFNFGNQIPQNLCHPFGVIFFQLRCIDHVDLLGAVSAEFPGILDPMSDHDGVHFRTKSPGQFGRLGDQLKGHLLDFSVEMLADD